MPLFNPVLVTVSSPVSTSVTRSTVAVPANIANAVVLVAVNANRKTLTLLNRSTGTVYLEKGAAPTATVHAVAIAPGGYYEEPQPVFTGEFQGLWSAAGGDGVLVREGI